MITPQNLLGNLYREAVELIDDGDAENAQKAIMAAQMEVKGYLSRYDADATLAADNALLDVYVRDIAVWHFIVLGNPTIEEPYRLARYERAIEFLTSVQKGVVNLAGAIELQPSSSDPNAGGSFTVLAEKRRRNAF